MFVSVDDVVMVENSYKFYQVYLYYGNYLLVWFIYVLLNDFCNVLFWGFVFFFIFDRGQWIILKFGFVLVIQLVCIVDVKDE